MNKRETICLSRVLFNSLRGISQINPYNMTLKLLKAVGSCLKIKL